MKASDILLPLWETMKGILPLTGIMLIVQIVILRKPINNIKEFVIGVLFASIGLHLFLKGTGMSLIPVSYTHLDVYKRQELQLS